MLRARKGEVSAINLPPVFTNRGCTGYEHIDDMDCIHTNGRVYDPALGRLLSADPHIQSSYNTQSYNRYSYVQNKPLKYTDPSGYFLGGLFKSIFNVMSKIVKAVSSMLPGYNYIVKPAALRALAKVPLHVSLVLATCSDIRLRH